MNFDISTLITLGAASFVFGFVSDFADLLDEHGLKWFRGAAILCGLIWGISGALMFILYPAIGPYVLATLLFWLVMNKLDYLNHQLAAALIFLTAFWQFQQGRLDLHLTIVSFVLIAGLAVVSSYIKKNYKKFGFLSLRHYVAPLVISVTIGSILPTLLHMIVMSGVMLSTKWFETFEKNPHLGFAKQLKLSITESENGVSSNIS